MDNKCSDKTVIDKNDAIDILDRTINFIQNCDTKASVVLGSFGVAITVALTTDGLKSIFKIYSTIFNGKCVFWTGTYFVLFSISILVMLFGLSQIIRVLGAKTEVPHEDGLLDSSNVFFEGISENNFMNYRKKLLSLTEEEMLNEIVSEIYKNSCICHDKYKYYKCGFRWLLIGAGAFIVLWIIGIKLYCGV